MAVGSYLRVCDDPVETEVVVVLVVEGCCSPMQTYCVTGSAAPALPLPKTSKLAKIPQEKGRPEIVTVDRAWSSSILFFAVVKHSTEPPISSKPISAHVWLKSSKT